jgi:pimeloyl-ACP methyl ester carboxylesterase
MGLRLKLRMKRVFLGILVLANLALAWPGIAQTQLQPQAPSKTGIVLMHGKTGTPLGSPILDLAWALLNAGYWVALPEMCWSRTRIYDESYLDCFADIDTAVANLRAQGVTRIVIAGHSLGGNAALGYGARHGGLAGIIALAPAPDNRYLVRQPVVAASLIRAQELIAAGKGDERMEFTDYNNGRAGLGPITVNATPRVFESFDAADGPAALTSNLPGLKAPLLMVAGDSDPSMHDPGGLFDLAPANPLNRLVNVKADHMGTPQAAIDAVLAWLASLPPH